MGTRLSELAIERRLGRAATLDDLAGFDEVVLATGIRPRHPDIAGIDHPKVAGYLEVLTGTHPVGQRVAIGTPLMSIVPIDQAFVDANFKEVQLKKVRVGQSVEVEADLYGGGVKYHGTVVGVGGGTGSAFAVIPAQNATGNWIKVVQRLPVRIRLDPKDLAAHPLRVGLSVKADIDTASGSAR